MIDSSGLRLWLVPREPEIEAGTIDAGYSVGFLQFVPPRQESFITYGCCPSECLDQVRLHTILETRILQY